MKITHLPSAQPYELYPNTQLEIDRPNLFFSSWGEQSMPIDLPDTPHNRALIGHPHLLSNRAKAEASIPCVISHGDYHMPARQAILSVRKGEKIATSFYMNEGSFLSRISDVPLSDIFKDETIPGVSTVQQGIDFCMSLRDNTHPHFAIFPIALELDGATRLVNRLEHLDQANNPTIDTTRPIAFYNSVDRIEVVNDRKIRLSPGYYISPFIRASYVLKRIFNHFGYTLTDHFLLSGKPFGDMVFINNTIDSLVNGTILLTHLIPDAMCSTILNLYRKRFCCEFIPNEVARTVSIKLFNDIINETPHTDLTPFLTKQPEISYPDYRQLKLESETTVSPAGFNSELHPYRANYESYQGAYELAARHPETFYDPKDGCYYRMGYSSHECLQCISDGNLPYYAGGILKAHEVKVPDTAFSLIPPGDRRGVKSLSFQYPVPYIGDGRALNSTLVDATTSNENNDETSVSTSAGIIGQHDQKPILAFIDFKKGFCFGTNHGVGGYSLLYNGPTGIFEKFYRGFDNVLRNSLHKVTADLLIPDVLKSSLSPHQKVSLQGVDLLFNSFKYTVGGKEEPTTSELLTLPLYEPTSLAPSESERFPLQPTYKWHPVITSTQVTKDEFRAQGYLEDESYYKRRGVTSPPLIYPAPPTEEQYKSGKTYHQRTYYSMDYIARGQIFGYFRNEVALKAVPFDYVPPRR